MTDREQRLPKWAQNELLRLRRRVESLESDRLSVVPTNTAIDHYSFPPVYLDDDETIMFSLAGPYDSDNRFKSPHVSARVTEYGLYVMAGDRLTIHPNGGNTIYVRDQR
jgi:hypothetical protein